MKKKLKISNTIFLSYFSLIFLISIGVLIYLRTVISDSDFTKGQNRNINVTINNNSNNLNNPNLRDIGEFKVIYLKNVQEANLVQNSNYAVDIPQESMRLRNDTLFIENCGSVQIEFSDISSIFVEENTKINLAAFGGNNLNINCSNSEINLAALDLNLLNLISNGNCEINLAASKITTLNIDFLGKNEVNLMAKITNLVGQNSDETKISMFPKPKNISVDGNVNFNN